MQILKSDVPQKFHELIKRTEDNLEQVILHLHAMRPDDLPLIKWEWDEWQPDLLNEDAYPQFHARELQTAKLYQVLWAIPICGRDQKQHWHDKDALDHGTARQVLLFQFALTAQGETLQNQALECFIGMYEGYNTQDGSSVESLFRNPDGNTMPVTVPLLIDLVERIDKLGQRLNLEKRASMVMRDIQHLHDSWAAEAIRNRPAE